MFLLSLGNWQTLQCTEEILLGNFNEVTLAKKWGGGGKKLETNTARFRDSIQSFSVNLQLYYSTPSAYYTDMYIYECSSSKKLTLKLA